MSSVAKTSLTADISMLVQGEAADATDVIPAVTDLLNHNKSGRLAVSSGDTHAKHLENALAVGSGLAITKIDALADEKLRLDIDTLILVTLTGAQTLSDKTLLLPVIASFLNANHTHQNAAGGGQLNASSVFNAGTVPSVRGGLNVDASGFTGLMKMTAGTASVATAETDFVTPTGTGTLTGKTMPAGSGNAINVGALAASGAASGDIVTFNGSSWGPAPAGGGGATPVDVTTIAAGEALAERDFVYLTSANTWKKVDIDASPVLMGRWRGIVNQAGGIANAATGSVRLMGEVSGFAGLTAGAFVYASSTAGSFTQTRPSPTLGGTQVAVVPIGLATSTTKILLMGPARMQYRKRASTANNGTILIEHHDDPFGEGRLPRAFISTNDIAVVQNYDIANLSTNWAIKGPVGAGAGVSVDVAGTNVTAVGAGASDQFKAAQSVVLTAGVLTQITFFLDTNTGTPNTPNITVEIRANNAGIPAASALWTTSHAATASANNTITVTDGTFFDAGTYWIVWSVPTQTLNNRYNLRYNTANPYAAGAAKSDSSASAGTWVGTLTGTPDVRCTITTSAVIIYDRYTQGFTHTSPVSIAGARVPLSKIGTPVDNLTLSIYADSAGNPGSLLGSSATVSSSGLSGSPVMTEFSFSSVIPISASTTYHLVLSTSGSQSNTNYVLVGADTTSSGYANGVAKYENTSTWTAIGGDLIFDILAIVTSYNEPCVIGRSSGGTRDVAVRYDSGTSGVNTATNTQGKNVSGGTLDITFVVEMD